MSVFQEYRPVLWRHCSPDRRDAASHAGDRGEAGRLVDRGWLCGFTVSCQSFGQLCILTASNRCLHVLVHVHMQIRQQYIYFAAQLSPVGVLGSYAIMAICFMRLRTRLSTTAKAYSVGTKGRGGRMFLMPFWLIHPAPPAHVTNYALRFEHAAASHIFG